MPSYEIPERITHHHVFELAVLIVQLMSPAADPIGAMAMEAPSSTRTTRIAQPSIALPEILQVRILHAFPEPMPGWPRPDADRTMIFQSSQQVLPLRQLFIQILLPLGKVLPPAARWIGWDFPRKLVNRMLVSSVTTRI